MVWNRVLSLSLMGAGFVVAGAAQPARAGDLRISIPKSSKFTPVQRLNREGVEAVQKHHYEKAKTLFYRAYLFDPDDPFTLNNLGYISELEGDAEKAQRFYGLSSQRMTDAVVDVASSKKAKGKTVEELASAVQDVPLQVNRSNVEAVRLLSSGRAVEADTLLQQNLALDPENAFTLNNLGVAKEMQGEPQDALKYYNAAANSNSKYPVVVTVNPSWRGKPISEMAADSARKVQVSLQHEDANIKVADLNLRGVSALNHNNRNLAREFFRQAYALDPENAFALNNLGYLAELQGDAETAQFFYDKAERAQGAGARVGLATRRSAEGMKLAEVATGNQDKIETKITEQRAARSRQPGPIQLKHRDGTPVTHPEPTPASGAPQPVPQSQESPGLGPPQPQIPQLTPQN